MKANINTTLIQQLVAKNKPFDVWDEKLTGFLIRVNVSGKMVYMCQYGRGKRITIGKIGIISPTQARDRAKEILGDVVKGIDPKGIKQVHTPNLTFAAYLEKYYQPWVITHRKSGKETMANIKRNFHDLLGNKVLSEISTLQMEQWRTKRLQAKISDETINRDFTALRAALNKAVEWKIIHTHPLAELKLSKVELPTHVRFLSREEETRLREAFEDREERIRQSRDSGNLWRQEREYSLWPSLRDQPFVDAIKPMVLLSLNTGMRRGELFNLTWQDINFSQAILTVRATSAKSGKTRYIPLNDEALEVLKNWQQQLGTVEGLVFPNKNGQRLTTVKRAWSTLLKQAGITKFRWHDMRHHFASSLVMAGVNLNTVRELLGHSDIKMTLRYAHLSSEHKANAVAKLMTWRDPQSSDYLQQLVS